MILSLLDTDFYKFTMMQLILHHYPTATAEYQFVLRSKDEDLLPYADEIETAIQTLAQVKPTIEDIHFLRTLGFFKEDYLDALSNFRFKLDYVKVKRVPEFGLTVEGPWFETILFEVPLLAIIAEVVMKNKYPNITLAEARKRLQAKIETVRRHPLGPEFRFCDFGTRRRYQSDWQKELVQTLANALPTQFIGTSNVHLARLTNLAPIGTMAHEYIQAHQALVEDLENSQKVAFDIWLDEYQGQLSIALSDTLGLNPFLNDFDSRLARVYRGARQDSGDPIAWGKAVIQHYQQLGIDPKTKQFVFSDALTIERAFQILEIFHHQVQVVFGIGTNLTNDTGYPPVDMVIKMVRCNGKPVAKLSDTPGKSICVDQHFLDKLRNSLTH